MAEPQEERLFYVDLFNLNKKKSIVWKYFGRLKKGDTTIDEIKLYCQICVDNGQINSK